MEDGECTKEFCARLSRAQAIGASLQKVWKTHSIPVLTNTRLMKALMWPVAMYGCESWDTPKEWRNASWGLWSERTEKDPTCFLDNKENKWVGTTAGTARGLLDFVKARKPAYFSHTKRKQGNCLEKQIMQRTLPGRCRKGRHCMAWINISTWTKLSVEGSIRMTNDRDQWRKYTSMVWPTLSSADGWWTGLNWTDDDDYKPEVWTVLITQSARGYLLRTSCTPGLILLKQKDIQYMVFRKKHQNGLF